MTLGTVLISLAAIPASRNRSRSRDRSWTSSSRLQLDALTLLFTICTHAPPTLNSTFPGKGSRSGPFPKSREYHSRDFEMSLTAITTIVSFTSIARCVVAFCTLSSSFCRLKNLDRLSILMRLPLNTQSSSNVYSSRLGHSLELGLRKCHRSFVPNAGRATCQGRVLFPH